MIDKYSNIQEVWYCDGSGVIRCGKIAKVCGLLDDLRAIEGEYITVGNRRDYAFFPISALFATKEECQAAGNPVSEQMTYFLEEADRILSEYIEQHKDEAVSVSWFTEKAIELAVSMAQLGGARNTDRKQKERD